MTEFTATNGVKIVQDDEHTAIRSEWGTTPLSGREFAALTEFVQAQADEKYGRVRLPEYPDYVIYELPDDHEPKKIRIVHEGDPGRSYTWNRHLADADVPNPQEPKLVARLYFERYPEPTPVPHCCMISCVRPATWTLYIGNGPDDNTQACNEHVSELLGPSPLVGIEPVEVTP